MASHRGEPIAMWRELAGHLAIRSCCSYNANDHQRHPHLTGADSFRSLTFLGISAQRRSQSAPNWGSTAAVRVGVKGLFRGWSIFQTARAGESAVCASLLNNPTDRSRFSVMAQDKAPRKARPGSNSRRPTEKLEDFECALSLEQVLKLAKAGQVKSIKARPRRRGAEPSTMIQ